MSCLWCEENDNIIKLCEILDHRICNECYNDYLKYFPKRVKGCPYCIGIEEITQTQDIIGNDEINREPLINNSNSNIIIFTRERTENLINNNSRTLYCIRVCLYFFYLSCFAFSIKITIIILNQF